jgi:hypothetical protein
MGSCLVVVAVVAARAADAPPAALVERLADPSFAVRVQAADGLRRLGRQAEAPLRAGLHSADAEVRRQCRTLLAEILRADREARLKAFREGKEDPSDPPAGWPWFARLAGADAASRGTFAALYQAEGELLEMAERAPPEAVPPVAERATRLAGLCITPRHEDDAVTETTLLIFVVAAGRVSVSGATRDALMSGLDVLAHRQAVREAFLKDPARRRLLLAMLRQATGPAAGRALAVAGALRLNDAAGWILDVARDRQRTGAVRGWALLAVGQVGSREQVNALNDLLGEKTAIGTRRLGKQTLYAEVRDLALAATIRLQGGQLADYGFPYLRALPGVEDVPHPACLGFADAASREAAFRKWRAHAGPRP